MIREARFEDADEVCLVLRDSIKTLCIQDHKNDQFKLNKWLENKTPDNCKKWIEGKSSKVFVAILSDIVSGVIAVLDNGYIFLCYLSAHAKDQGLGKAMLYKAENWMKSNGCSTFRTHSTATALGFYKKHGYVESGKPELEDGMFSYPLVKSVNL